MLISLSLQGKSGAQVANVLNFNVGPEVELTLPPVFFSRLRLLFGSNKFVKDQVGSLSQKNCAFIVCASVHALVLKHV